MVEARLCMQIHYDQEDMLVLEKAEDVLNEVCKAIRKCGLEEHWAERTNEAKLIIHDLLEGCLW